MDTAYNRRIASINDAIMERAARHAPANFVGRGFGSDSGIDTQYNDVMRGAANHPRALSQAEKEYRMEGSAAAFGGSFLDDIGQAFRYTPLGMASDAIQGRDTVLSGRGKLTITHGGAGYGGAGYGGAGYGGASATDVGVTMPYREVPYAGVVDKALSVRGSAAPKFPLETKVQVGNSDGSGKPQVEAAWYENFDDFKSGRNRMKDSKKVGRMTKDPELLASGGRDFTKEELEFVQDLLSKSGAGFYGGAWYNNWDDFTEAISEAYDTVKGVWEDYIKPVLDVVGTPLKEALIDSGNPYGEAAGGVLELLGYGQNGVSGGMYGAPSGMSGGMYGAPSGMSGGMYGAPSGMSGGRAGVSGGRLVKGSPEAKAYMASIRAKRGSKGGNMSMGMGIGGMKGCGEGVFADAKPIAANSLGFSPKLEVEQLNSATGSTSYGDMPTSNPVGSGIGGRKRKIVPKNSRGVSSAPTKMGELEGGITYQDILALGRRGLDNILIPAATAFANAIVSGVVVAPSAVMTAARTLKAGYNHQAFQVLLRFAKDNAKLFVPFLPTTYAVGATALLLLKAYFDTPDVPVAPPPPRPPTPAMRDEDDVVVVGHGGKKGGRNWWDGMTKDDWAKYLGEMGDAPKPVEDAIKPVVGIRPAVIEQGNPYGNMSKEESDKMMRDMGYGKKGGRKISRKTNMKEREGLLVSGDNSMGAIVAERGYSAKAQKKSGAVDEVASQNIWDGTQMENTTGRSAKKINNLILNGVTKGVSQGGAMSGGAHPLTQTNNLHAVFGGSAMMKMKSEYSGRGQHGGKSAYNAFVSKTMKEKGMKLAEAVKYIKANGLYKK
jgi:hypothetical protein